jgi:hypothetical protein
VRWRPAITTILSKCLFSKALVLDERSRINEVGGSIPFKALEKSIALA